MGSLDRQTALNGSQTGKSDQLTLSSLAWLPLPATRITQQWATDSLVMGLSPHPRATGKVAKAITILWAVSDLLTAWFAI